MKDPDVYGTLEGDGPHGPPVHGVWVVSRVSKQVGLGRAQATVLPPPESVNLPVVEPNPRGHQPGERCREPGCGNCHWDVQRFKYWLRGRLLAGGADDAEVDKSLGAQTPSLVWRNGTRLCAIEVRSAPVDMAQAAERTARLRAVGVDEVLWLCPPGFWVAHLSAVAVDDFAAAGCEYRVVSGLLATGPTGAAVPCERAWTVRDVMQEWVTGALAFGWRDEITGGWASVGTWEQHTRLQAAMIAQQRQELMNQRTALALARKVTREKAKQVHKLLHRLERSEQIADDLDAARRTISEHGRIDATLRLTVARQRQALTHWQLITCFALLIIVAVVGSAMILR